MSDTALWHPFSNMATVRDAELTITRGDDVWLWDAAGRRYLDASASLWYANVGHGRREIADAVARAAARAGGLQRLRRHRQPSPAIELAERLADLAPRRPRRCSSRTGGGEAVDTAGEARAPGTGRALGAAAARPA